VPASKLSSTPSSSSAGVGSAGSSCASCAVMLVVGGCGSNCCAGCGCGGLWLLYVRPQLCAPLLLRLWLRLRALLWWRLRAPLLLRLPLWVRSCSQVC
jgi:hypothetical protein